MGCDHAGYPLKETLKAYLTEHGHEVLDVGTDSEEMVDYPDFCAAAARAVATPRSFPAASNNASAFCSSGKACS